MLTLQQIKPFFSKQEHAFPQHMIREYLQYLILDSIFASKYGSKLKFIGGTCIRILHGGVRFSEDLDFDNDNLLLADFKELVKLVVKSLEKQGFTVETKIVSRGAFRCYVKLPGLFYDFGLSNNDKQKLSIYIDTTHQNFKNTSANILINKFGVYREVRTQPVDIILSQKILALLERPRMKGRDIYDIVYLWSMTKPNFKYLLQKKHIAGMQDLFKALEKAIADKDLKKLARDVAAFVPKDGGVLEVTMFDRWLKQEQGKVLEI